MLVIELNEAWAKRVKVLIERYSLVTGIDLTPERAIQTAIQEEIDRLEREYPELIALVAAQHAATTSSKGG